MIHWQIVQVKQNWSSFTLLKCLQRCFDASGVLHFFGTSAVQIRKVNHHLKPTLKCHSWLSLLTYLHVLVSIHPMAQWSSECTTGSISGFILWCWYVHLSNPTGICICTNKAPCFQFLTISNFQLTLFQKIWQLETPLSVWPSGHLAAGKQTWPNSVWTTLRLCTSPSFKFLYHTPMTTCHNPSGWEQQQQQQQQGCDEDKNETIMRRVGA